MLRKAFLIVVVAAAMAICLGGCKKKSSNEASPKVPAANEVPKPRAQYDAEAKKDITDENLEAKLAELEKEVDTDAAADAGQ